MADKDAEEIKPAMAHNHTLQNGPSNVFYYEKYPTCAPEPKVSLVKDVSAVKVNTSTTPLFRSFIILASFVPYTPYTTY
jgi:hypothetical protein